MLPKIETPPSPKLVQFGLKISQLVKEIQPVLSFDYIIFSNKTHIYFLNKNLRIFRRKEKKTVKKLDISRDVLNQNILLP